MSMNNRKLSNFMLTPRFQLKLTYYYLGIGLVIIASTVATVFIKMRTVRDVMNNSVATDFSVQSRISDHMFEIAQISMLGFAAFAIASLIFALMVSHRIAGPIVAITTFIGELKKGNYDYPRSLRPGDELTLIMDALHELRDSLKNGK